MPADPAPRGRRPPVPANASDSTTPGRGTGPSRRRDWQLLVADLSGLPAIARIIEELPDGVPATVIVEVADATTSTICPRVRTSPSSPASAPETATPQADSRSSAANSRCPTARGYCWFAGGGGRIPRRAQAPARQRLDHRPVRHHRLLAVRLRDLGRQSSPSSQTRSSRSTSAPSPTARATRWPPRSSTRHSNGPGSRPS